ncbi:hypothetical protein [Pseudarthrobacter sp. R1]|nr:hypothetical protein [Pseudarthrobacter sp. R1]
MTSLRTVVPGLGKSLGTTEPLYDGTVSGHSPGAATLRRTE